MENTRYALSNFDMVWKIYFDWYNNTAQGNNLEIPAINALTGATFKKKGTKLYIPVVTLSTENYNKLLEQIKIGFIRTIK